MNPFRTDQALAGALGGFNNAQQVNDDPFARSLTGTLNGIQTPTLNYNTPSFGVVQQQNSSSFGGLGNSMIGGMQKSPEQIAQAMAQAVMNQFTRGVIRFIEDFFLAYDLYQSRQYEAWELPSIFQDSITLNEAQDICRASGGSISYQMIYKQITQRSSSLPTNPSMVQAQSVFMSKPRTSQHLQRVLSVFQQSRQRGQTFQDAFTSLFSKSYIDSMDFQRFLSSPQVGFTLPPYESEQLFSYFKISQETMVSRIAFVQALKALETLPQSTLGNNFGAGAIASGQQVGGLSPMVAEMIRKALETNRITDLRDFHQTGMIVRYLPPPSHKAVVTLEQFVNFLRQLLLVDQQSSLQLAQTFVLNQGGLGALAQQQDLFIDFESFQSQVYQSMASLGQNQFMQTYEQQRPTYQVIQKYADMIRRYLLVNGGNIQAFFERADLDHDNILSENELKYAFQQMGAQMSDGEVNSLIRLFDKNGDGKVSYSELCSYFADVASAKAIKDINHWAYYIFETLRRHCNGHQQSLFALFGLNPQTFTGYDSQQQVRLPRDQLFRTLFQLQIPLSPEYEKRLLNLLDVGNTGSVGFGGMQNQDIDFLFFSELVGVHYQPVNLIQSQMRTNPSFNTPIGQASRKFFRTLVKAINKTKCSLEQLEAMMRAADKSNGFGGANFGQQMQGVIPFSEFQSKLQFIVGQAVDAQLIQQVGQRFQGSIPNTINYKEFISCARFEQEKVKIVDLVFSSLCAALAKFNVLFLRELFQKAQPNFILAPTLDKNTLDMILKASGGAPLESWELDIIIDEYQTDATHLSFDSFEADFKEYQTNGANPQQTPLQLEFQKVGLNRGPSSLGGGRTGTSSSNVMIVPQHIKQILQRMSNVLDLDDRISIRSILSQYQTNLNSGTLSTANFKSMLAITFRLRDEEVKHMIDTYDQMNRGEIHIEQVLEQIKDMVQQMRLRLEIIDLVTGFGKNPAAASFGGANPEQMIISQYGQDLEEIYRATLARDFTNTAQLFANYSQTKTTVPLGGFTSALYSLGLSRDWKPHELEQLFRFLDTSGQGQLDIRALDGFLVRVIMRKPVDVMYEEVLERVARTYNGDEQFLIREMQKRASVQSPKHIEVSQFISVIRDYQPMQSLGLIDVKFLSKKYADQLTKLIDINTFHQDLRKLMQKAGIIPGTYTQHLTPGFGGGALGSATTAETRLVAPNQWTGYVPTNPGLGSRNTRTEQLEGSLDFERRSFHTSLSESYFEQLVMSTYVAGQTVYEYFLNYVHQKGDPSETIMPQDFIAGILSLKVGWTQSSAQDFFTQVDRWAHKGAASGKLNCMELDRAVCLGCKKTIPEMHDEILQQIVQECQKRSLDFKSLIQAADIGRSLVISIDSLVKIILNQMKVGALLQPDVVFLAKKYLVDLPTHIQYVKLLEDYEVMAKTASLSAISGSNYQLMCTFIRKACLAYHNAVDPSQYFKTKCVQYPRDFLMPPGDFQKAIADLNLGTEVFPNDQAVNSLYGEIDSANTKKVTMDQVDFYIKKMSMKVDLKGLQDDVISELAQKVKQKGTKIENMFRLEDPKDRARIPESSFIMILRSSLQVKEVDAKLLSLRYLDSSTAKNISPEVNYKQFIQQLQDKTKTLGNISLPDSTQPPSNALLQPGLHGFDPNTDIGRRLTTILSQINTYVKRAGISLANILAKQETPGGLVLYDSFVSALRQLFISGVSEDDLRFIGENYLMVATSAMSTMPRSVDYRKFLSDLNTYGTGTNVTAGKTIQSLTLEQQRLYTDLSQHIQKRQTANKFVSAFLDIDSSLKGYLSQQSITQIFRQQGYNTFSEKQFAILFSALDTNSQGEYNYKQIFELLLGPEQAQQVFIGATMGGPRPGAPTQQFLMPLNPQGAKSPILGEIGRKLIASGKNYEEDFKSRTNGIGDRCAESDIWGVLGTCGVKLTSDENNAFSSLLLSLKDNYGAYPVMEVLSSIGLPAQTLGLRGQKSIPRKVLNDQERKRCQTVIISLRRELDLFKKKPEEVFEKCRSTKTQVSIPEANFRLALTQTPDFGETGRLLSDEDIRLLVYYLTQEVPGEVSYRKLYLAFTQTEKDVPLAQEGSDDIQRYNQMLKDKMRQATPMEVIELVTFMRQNSLSLSSVFKNAPQNGLITVQEFQTALQNAGFASKGISKLVEALDTQGKRLSVSLQRLGEYMSKSASNAAAGRSGVSAQAAREKYQRFDPKVRQILQQISEHMKRMNITLNQLFDQMDADKNGQLSRDEFVMSMPQVLHIPGVTMREYAQIFEDLDANKDGSLSLSEFGMYIEGAKLDKQQRLALIDPKIAQELQNDALALFNQFDQDKNGQISSSELQYAMKTLGRDVSIEEAKAMLAQVDRNGDGQINQQEFCDFILPKMKEELLAYDDNVEELRARFMDADVDHSGVLSIDEIYGVLLGMGADLRMEELIELMNEIDVDRNGTLDIDEFVALLSVCGNEIQLQSEGARKTLMGLKRVRRVTPMDFIKQFKSMPSSFVPSFFGVRWGQRKNLPSSVFMPRIDPKTMLYKDIMPVLQENIPGNVAATKEYHPKVRPFNSEVGCEFIFDQATGVPLPAGDQFDRSNIVKRAVRVGIYDALKRDYVHNAVQCPALYSGEVAEDIWTFQAPRENSLNPILFRSASRDEVKKPNLFMIFELVIYVRQGEKVIEMSCGWAQMDLDNIDQFGRAMTHKLTIKGGTPAAEMLIQESDIHKNRTGIIHSLQKLVQTKVESQLIVQVRPMNKFSDDVQFHMNMLPTVCLLPERLLQFVSGFRNFLGDKLLTKQVGGVISFKKPQGDPMLTTFKRIFDSNDILEVLVPIWVEDVLNQLTSKQKMNVDHIMFKTKETLRKLYPVTYADGFKYTEAFCTASAAGDIQLLRNREELVKSALRYGHAQAKIKFDRPIESLSTFKPFTVRELDFQVWEDHTENQVDNILQQYSEYGMLAPSQQAPPTSSVAFGQSQQQFAPNAQMMSQSNAFSHMMPPSINNTPQMGGTASTGFNRFSLADQMNMRMTR